MPKLTRVDKDVRLNNIDVHIPSSIAWSDDVEITLQIKFLFGVIFELSRNKYYCCYASNDNLGSRLGKDERSIRRYIELLENKKYLTRVDAEIRDSDGKIRQHRAIVPLEFLSKFERMQNKMLDLKRSQKNTRRADKVVLSRADKVVRKYIKDKYPYENNITNSYIKEGYSTPTPSKGKAVTLIENEPYEVLGTFKNVRLTQSQKAAFSEEFGAEMLSSLIEQISAHIASGLKRVRKNTNFYAMLRDWALRRTEPKYTATEKRSLVNGKDIARREYSSDDIDALFSPLDE